MSEVGSSDSIGQTETAPNVLVVDDDKDLADTYAVWLSDICDVETAYDGVQARKRIEPSIDIVLLDRRMPDIPGDKVLEDIRDQEIGCQVAMLTAVKPDTDIIDLPFDEYLVKPVTKSELRKMVDWLSLCSDFDEDVREYLAMESKRNVLETRDEENLRDPEAAAELKDDTEQAKQLERIQDLKSQLHRLQRITSVIRDINKQLVVASSRGEIEQTTCERLVNAEPYELAWIGDYTVSFDQVTPRVVAGEDVMLDENVAADGGSSPIAEAVSAESVQVVDDLTAGRAPKSLEPINSADMAQNFTAGAVIPLIYRDAVYGVLNVYTDEDGVFDEREVSVLSELGDSIANAISSVESKKLMLSDKVIELEFETRDPRDVFVSLSAETGSRIELKAFVPAADGTLTSYLEVTGTTTEAFLNAATEMQSTDTIRGINDSNEQHLYECRVNETVVLSLIEAGGHVESMHTDDGAGHLTAAVAPETDVRTVVESVQNNFEEIDLVAKRETERDIQSTENFRQSLENRLTDRQYSVLKAAYSADYFSWPRGSTAKEIAQSLDLAPPTLHEHLRGAQKELIGTFFDETGEFHDNDPLQSIDD